MVWPNFFLMNVFFALKGSKLFTVANPDRGDSMSLTLMIITKYVLAIFDGTCFENRLHVFLVHESKQHMSRNSAYKIPIKSHYLLDYHRTVSQHVS